MKNYQIHEKYDVKDNIIEERKKEQSNKISSEELSELNEDTVYKAEEPEKSNTDLTLEDFYIEGKYNLPELKTFLSVCLDRKSIIQVCTDVKTFDPETRVIALTNPICPYELLKEISLNESGNYTKFEMYFAKINIEKREKEN